MSVLRDSTTTSEYDDGSLYLATTQSPATFEDERENANQQRWHSLSWADAPPSPPLSNASNSSSLAEFLAAATNSNAYLKLTQLAHSMGLDIHNSSDKRQVEQWLLNLAASSTINPFVLQNDTISSSNTDGESAYNVIAREFRLFFYALIFIVCVFGNALVVITLAQNRRMRTVTNIFLINLAASGKFPARGFKMGVEKGTVSLSSMRCSMHERERYKQ